MLTSAAPTAGADDTDGSSAPIVAQFQITSQRPSQYRAFYAQPQGDEMINTSERSDNHGATWLLNTIHPDFAAGLPLGYRRYRATEFVDPNNGYVVGIYNAMDTPGLDPRTREPNIALKTYYLRYRVSSDGGQSWDFDSTIVGDHQTPEQPFDGLKIGNNAFFIGDLGCRPIVTQAGTILLPAQMTLQGEQGKLSNPGRGHTYTDALVLRGEWGEHNTIRWSPADRVKGDPNRSTRGMIEPTLAQFDDGRILMVMRGSNDANLELPARRWFSVSSDDGQTWTIPSPWTYSNGNEFYSPSAMSNLYRHSSGRVFWVGNLHDQNCVGNHPRWPVVFAEVNASSLQLIEETKLQIDTKGPQDEGRRNLSLCHFTLYEDRQTKELVLCYPRSFNNYRDQEWAIARIAVP